MTPQIGSAPEPLSGEVPDGSEGAASHFARRTSITPVIDFLVRRRVLIFPAIVLLILSVFTALGISGSSSPLLAPDAGSGDSVIIGSPRSIRSDEWIVHTPLVISQVENGKPRFGDVGVGSHDMSVLSDLPVADVLLVFHPNQWGYYLLPFDNAYAFDWWSISALMLVGTYIFLLAIIGSIRWSILGALFLFGSPFFHWWYTASSFALIGWLTLSASCFLFAVRSSGRQRLALSLAAAFAASCFALVIYPPWQIPVAISIGAITAGALWASVRAKETDLRRVVATAVFSGVLSAIPMAYFLVSRRPALDAISNTVYPGARVVAGGELPWEHLFTSWFGLNYVTNGPALRGAVFPNESEASSFLFLGVLLLLAVPVVWRYILPLGERLRSIAMATIAVMILFLTHMLVGLPSVLAKVTLLSMVPERRGLIGLGFASMVLVVIVGSSVDRFPIPRMARTVAGCVLVGLLGAGVVGLAQGFRSVDAPVGTRLIIVAVLMAGATGAIFFWRPVISVGLLVIFGLAISLSANPLIRGMSQTRESEVVLAIRQADSSQPAASRDEPAAWIGETYPVASLLTTAGVRNLSGVNLYPNFPAWSILDPDRSYVDAWNRYAQAIWTFDVAVNRPVIRLVQADMVEVTVNPCDPALDRFGVSHLIAPRPIEASCLSGRVEVRGPESVPIYIYDRAPASSSVVDGWSVR